MDMMENTMKDYGIMTIPDVTSEAMAYVPFQSNAPATYGVLQGFEVGTMFPTLNKPFYGSKCMGEKND